MKNNITLLVITTFLLFNYYCISNDIQTEILFNKQIQRYISFYSDSLNYTDKYKVIERQIIDINSSLNLISQESEDDFFSSDAKYDSTCHSTWSMNNWFNSFKKILFFDFQKRVVKVDFYDYDLSKNDEWFWKYYKTGVYEYDPENNKVISYTETMPEWNSGDIKFVQRFLISYDSLDRFKEFIVQRYLNNEWVNEDKQIEYYNVYDQLERRFNCFWNNDEWFCDIQLLYFYNSIGELEEEYYQIGDGVNWINKFKTIYMYDHSGNMIGKENKRNIEGEWIDSTKMCISYTQSNKYLKIIYYQWKDSVYDITQMVDFKYDKSDNLIEKLTAIDSSGNIVNFLKGLYSYDNFNNLILSIYQRWNADWTNDTKTEYYYGTKLKVDEFESFKKSNFHIKPNPSSEYIEISNFNHTINRMVDELLDIKIYNVFGECLLSVGANSRSPLQRIDISHFPNGIYFIRIGEEYGKFIKY
jgi:hypothetical protein